MKNELIPTVILPTSAEVGNIINQLKSEFSKFDADTLSASLMVQTLHKRLCTAIKCSVEVKITADIIDSKANTISAGQDISTVMEKLILKRARGSEKYPVTWIIQLGEKDVLFSRVVNGCIDEGYAPVNRQKANVYASAILNDLEPPRHLQKSDKPTVQTQSE
ncbi:hypothetical protein HGO23_12990 [Xenorhabdus budapestensis]|uniref:Phage protein n=1 Tax=Xenorhabdus budapestensis TaxID=290110 RepID=A0ABX7VE73_XENBU|nr:hypothetical protein [Xenorhabdus budapestensis]QTL38790.1 hypothetical protein HGO23_12990 [Xenorhabdus budapestensis]